MWRRYAPIYGFGEAALRAAKQNKRRPERIFLSISDAFGAPSQDIRENPSVHRRIIGETENRF
jgi:hypothetical protein